MADSGDQGVFKGMRKGSVAHIVQKDGNEYTALFFGGDLVSFLTQGVDGAAHQVHGADRMMESSVVGTGIHEVGEA